MRKLLHDNGGLALIANRIQDLLRPMFCFILLKFFSKIPSADPNSNRPIITIMVVIWAWNGLSRLRTSHYMHPTSAGDRIQSGEIVNTGRIARGSLEDI